MAPGRRSNTAPMAFDAMRADPSRCRGLHEQIHRGRLADGIGNLDLDALGQAGRDDVLANPAHGVAADRSTFDGSLPEKAPPPRAQPP